MTGIKKDISSI